MRIEGKTKEGDDVSYSIPDEDEERSGSRVTYWALGYCIGFNFDTEEEGRVFYDALLNVREVDAD